MDADRFDNIARSLTAGASRRGIARALGGVSLTAMLAPLLGLSDAEGKKKKRKKKKKCKGGTKKCGKKCIPSTNCCTTADCDEGESCQDGTCVTGCGPCQANQECIDGQCRCTTNSCDGCCDGVACRQGNTNQFCGHEGEVCDICGACQSCESGTCESRCTAGQQCLAHESCALTCSFPGGDPACDGFGADCSCRGTAEGGMHCRFSVSNCANLQSCTSTADCPKSQMCQECGDPADKRCVAICGYECTSDAECRPTCHCSVSDTEGHRYCEANGDCSGDLCTTSEECGTGKHCSTTTCGAGGSVEKRCVTICGTSFA